MDDKKISEEKNAEEIIADEKLESVAGGNTGTGHGYIPTATANIIEQYPVATTGGGHG